MSRGLPTISALDLWHESARTRPGELPENPRTKYLKKRYDFQRLEVFASSSSSENQNGMRAVSGVSRPPRARVPPRWRVGRGERILASHRDMPPLFDAGVPLEALPWGVEGDAPVSSRSFNYKAEDGETDLEAYFAWDPSLLEGGGGGLPGVLVAHTAIGPQEVFVHTCCDALAR